MQGESKMGQWLIDIGFDTFLGVAIIVLGFYFGIKMYLISLIADDPSTEANEAYYGGKKLRKSLKTKKKVD